MTNVTVCADDFGLTSGIVGHSRVPATPTGQCYELHNYASGMAELVRRTPVVCCNG